MKKRKIIVGSRESKLAVVQTQLVMDQISKHHPEIELELVTMKTTGDIILNKTLDKVGGKGLFVKELDKALIEKRVDITIHSLKDMPMDPNPELPLLAFYKRGNPYDALVLPKGCDELDLKKPIGSSSARRTLQLKELYEDAEFKSVRGNVITRLEKLDRGDYSALVLAYSGLARLGLEDRISKTFNHHEIIPSAGQGTLVVQGRAGEDYSFLECIDDEKTRIEALTEREFVRILDGGCSSPIGGFSMVEGEKIALFGLFYDDATGKYIKGKTEGNKKDGVKLAKALALKLKKDIQEQDASYRKGKVWLVGAGPSDVGLFTLKGKDVLEKADIVVYDKLVGQGVLGLIPEETETIFVGKVAGNHAVPQYRINEILLEEAQKGKNVVRLKGGDPFVFGRGGEELELLVENDIPFEIVPGITSAVAVPAYNGIPVTHRDFTSSFHIITGHTKDKEEPNINFEALVKLDATLIFLMGVSALPKICKGLLKAGMDKDMPAAILERGTRAHQRKVVSTIEHLPEESKAAKIGTPGIIIVGKVCQLANDFTWAEKRPLGDLKIAVTRPRDRSSKLAQELRFLGGEVVMLPAIKTLPIKNNQALDKELKRLKEYDWLAFTSPFGVKVFMDELRTRKMDVRNLIGIKIAVIGSGTQKAFEKYGVFVDLVPETYNGKALGEKLAETLKDEKILIPRAKLGTDEVLKPLKAANIQFTDLPIYDTISVSDNTLTKYDESIDYVAFTSASTVKAFAAHNQKIDLSKVNALCIGEQTAEIALNYQMKVVISEKATIKSMVDKLLELKK